jgi:hypothetical protein
MNPLALTDGLTVSLAAFQLAFGAIVSVALWRLTAWQRRYEGLEEKLHDATTRLIEERFGAMALQVDRRDQRIELTLATRLDVLKDYIREACATRKDLERHEAGAERRLSVLEQRLADLSTSVASVTGQAQPGR